MTKVEFLKDVSYAIDRMRGKMTIFYKNKPLKTILLHKIWITMKRMKD